MNKTYIKRLFANGLVRACIFTLGVLLVPLLAMQVSDEVNWGAEDFIVAAALLVGLGSAYELYIKKIPTRRSKYLYTALLVLGGVLLWAELAVGIFGSPIAGN